MSKHDEELREFRESVARYNAIPVHERPVIQYHRWKPSDFKKLLRELEKGMREYPHAEGRSYLGLALDGRVVVWMAVVTPGENGAPDTVHYVGDISWPCPPFCGLFEA